MDRPLLHGAVFGIFIHASAARVRGSALVLPPSNPASSSLPSMPTSAWITMIAVMTFVWGGFAMVVRTAVRSESGKTRS